MKKLLFLLPLLLCTKFAYADDSSIQVSNACLPCAPVATHATRVSSQQKQRASAPSAAETVHPLNEQANHLTYDLLMRFKKVHKSKC
jgi:hypothetical protein